MEDLSDRKIELSYLFVNPDVIGQSYSRQLRRYAKASRMQSAFTKTDGKQIGTKPSASLQGRELPVFKVDLV